MPSSAKAKAREIRAKLAAEATDSSALSQEEKASRMADLSLQLNKKAERPMLFRAGDDPEFGIARRIKTNIPSIDRATGGGIPRGMFTEVCGGESSGKTTLLYRLVGQCQRAGGVAVFIDAEYTYDRAWAMVNGTDVENLYVVTPTTLEESLQSIIDICKVGAADLIVLDSVVALATVGEKSRTLTDENIGRMAAKLSQFFKMSVSEVARSKAAVVMINQMRVAIGSYGAPDKAPGGKALAHYKALSLQTRKESTGPPSSSPYFTKVGGKYEQIGFPMGIKVTKTKVGGTYAGHTSHQSSSASVDFYFGTGLDARSDVVNMSLKLGLDCLKISGSWYDFTGENGKTTRTQGKPAFLDSLDDKDLAFIENQLLTKLSEGAELEEDDPDEGSESMEEAFD